MSNKGLTIKRIVSSKSSEYEHMKSLLIETFPACEYRDLGELQNLVDSDRDCDFYSNLVYLDDIPVGFINFWLIRLDSSNTKTENIPEVLKNELSVVTYIEHFAIDPSYRNGQLGSRVLNYFLTSYYPNLIPKSREEYQEPKFVVLEVEKPINASSDELSARRIRFYERLGFILLNIDYQQPPYRAGYEFIPMYLMSFGAIPPESTLQMIKSLIYKHVYRLI